MSIQQHCTQDVVTIDEDASARDAAQLMHDRHVGALVVARRGPKRPEVVGVVTDRDLVLKALRTVLAQVRAGAPRTTHAGDAEEPLTLPAQALARRWRQISAP